MLKILTTIYCVSVQLAAVEGKPGKFQHDYVTNHFQYRHLINMTGSFCKDAIYKLRMADLIQQTYKKSTGYELGIIAAGLMDKFRHMIKTYRYYSNAKNFKNEDHTIEQMMNAYSAMQSDYNEIIAETVLFYQVLEDHKKQDVEDDAKAKELAKKYGLTVKSIRAMQKQGVKLSDYGLVRRSMQTETEKPDYVEKQLEDKGDSLTQMLLEDPMTEIINVWTPKKNNNSQEEKYKKKMRYKMWAEKWNGFNGETEGVNIADSIARLGLTNDSDFLLKELKGAV